MGLKNLTKQTQQDIVANKLPSENYTPAVEFPL